MRIHVLGGCGFLGTRAIRYFRNHGHEVINYRIDVTDALALKVGFRRSSPDVVFNCAGARAEPNIDWCEDHKEETIAVNVTGSLNVALAALEANALPVQMSSGCLYDGGPERVFAEDDEPNYFGSFYSRMRFAMETALKELPVAVARIRMPISEEPHPRNVINKLLRYPKVISVPNSATSVEDLFPAIEMLMKHRATGIYNLTNDGYLEYETLLELYKKIVNPAYEYQIIRPEELQGLGLTKAGRSNCVLSNAKIRALGVSMPAFDEARLTKILTEYKKYPQPR